MARISRESLMKAGIGQAAKVAATKQDGSQAATIASIGKPILGTPIKDIAYDQTKGDIDQQQPRGVLRQLSEEYATKIGYGVTETLREALVRRANGEQVLSPREADILFRTELDPNHPLLRTIQSEFTAFITEGSALEKNNPWMLRYRYNRGIHWRDNDRKLATAEQQAKGDAMLVAIETELTDEWNLPLHPIERQLGFHPDLCRPETHNHKQFSEVYRDR